MTKKNITLLSLLGVAIGAGVVYLMTTEKGRSIRNNIKDKTNGLVDSLKKTKNHQVASSDGKNKVGSSHVPAY
jgi:gas vesicle protein